MLSPFVEKTVNSVHSPVDSVEVDVRILIVNPWAHPFAERMAPVLEVCLINPFCLVSDAGIIKAIL